MAINRINFTGEIFMPKQTDKFGFIIKGKTAAKKEYLRMNLGVRENDHNMAFTEMFGSEQDVIKARDNDGNNIEIAWKDRFDPEIVTSVSRRTIIDFTGLVVPSSKRVELDELHVEYENADTGVELKRAEFISTYDAIKYVHLVSDCLDKKKIIVTGQLNTSAYQGRYSERYQAANIYLAKEDAKNNLQLTLEVFFNKDSYDDSDEKSEKVVYLNGYIPMYLGKDEGTKYVPKTLVFNMAKAIELGLEKRVEAVKVEMKAPKNRYYHMVFVCKVLNGSEQVEITVDMLTKKQREHLELGLFKLEDFKKKTFGDRVQEVRIIRAALNETGFDEGLVECDETNDEFEEMIHTFVEIKEEKLEDAIEDEVPFEEEKKEEELDDDDIFG